MAIVRKAESNKCLFGLGHSWRDYSHPPLNIIPDKGTPYKAKIISENYKTTVLSLVHINKEETLGRVKILWEMKETPEERKEIWRVGVDSVEGKNTDM